MKKTIVTVAFSIFALCFCYAQETSSTNKQQAPQPAGAAPLSADWTFHNDENVKVLYIDMDSLKDTPTRLTVKNTKNNEVVVYEDLSNMPHGVIFEYDYRKLPKGDYLLEIHTFSGNATEPFTVF